MPRVRRGVRDRADDQVALRMPENAPERARLTSSRPKPRILRSDLHVLLRHRLLPQPGGFEGLLALGEHLTTNETALRVRFSRASPLGHQTRRRLRDLGR